MADEKRTRINKFLSQIGYCSRREADKLIDQGRVRINGEIAEMGVKIEAKDNVNFEGAL